MPAVHDNAATDAGPQDQADDDVPAPRGAERRLGQREAVGIVGEASFRA